MSHPNTNKILATGAIAIVVIAAITIAGFVMMIVSLFGSSDNQQQAANQEEQKIPFQDLYQEVAGKYASVPWTILAAVHYYSPEYEKHLEALNNFGVASLKGKDPAILAAVNEYAKMRGLDPLLVAAVIQAESNWNPRAKSPSVDIYCKDNSNPIGARGLMQVMPCHFKNDGLNPDTDGYDIRKNIEYGTKILKSYTAAFGGNIQLGVAAYNAGVGGVQNAGNQIPNNGQTEIYVPKVMGYYEQFKKENQATPVSTDDKNKVTMDTVKKWLEDKAKELANKADETKNDGKCLADAKIQKDKKLTIGTVSFPLSCAIYLQAPEQYKKTTDDQWKYVSNVEAKAEEYAGSIGGGSLGGPFGQRVVAAAKRWKDRPAAGGCFSPWIQRDNKCVIPYSWGGGNEKGPGEGFAQGAGIVGFDCSGLVHYALYHASGGKINLNITADGQARQGTHVPKNQIQAGDIIAFNNDTADSDYDHIGIYIGNNQMIVAPSTGSWVQIQDITDYWNRFPTEVRRYG
jgi:soluble lytic murein transglycosylase-like protein/cell wall-associated NlpC family hydrolase